MSEVDDLLKRTENLTPEEQLYLIARLADQTRRSYRALQPQRRWKEIGGTARYPLFGEDAQQWVSHSRAESDDERKQ